MRHQSAERSRPPLFTLPIVCLMAVQFLNGLVTSPSITFFPVYLSGLGLSAVFISFAVLIQRVTGLVSSVAGGIMSDSFSRKRTIIAGEILFFSGALAFLFRAPWAAALFWGASGFGMSLYSLASQNSFIDMADPRSLGILTAIYYWGYTAGATAGNPAAGWLLGVSGYPLMAVCLLSVSALTVAATALFMPRLRIPPAAPRRKLKGFFGYAEVMRRPQILVIGILRMLPTYSYGMLLVFIPLLLKEAGASNARIALFASLSSVCAALAQLAIGRASDRISPLMPSLASTAVLAVSCVGIGLFPGSLSVVFACGAAGVSAAWCLSTLVFPMVERAAAPADRGRVLGVLGLYWNVSMIVSALTGGFLYEAGRGWPFLAGAALCLPAFALTVLFFRLAPGGGGALEGNGGVAYRIENRRKP